MHLRASEDFWESEFSSILATGTVEKQAHLLARIPLADPSWAQMALKLIGREPLVMESWLFELNGDNLILNDDPLEPLQDDLFPEQIYFPRFEGLEKPYGAYAASYYRQRKLKECLMELQKLEEKSRGDLILLQNLAAVYEEAGFSEHALQRLRIVLKLTPDPDLRIQVKLRQIRLLSRLRRDQECLKLLRELRQELQKRVSQAKDRLESSPLEDQERFFAASQTEETLLAAIRNAEGAIHYRLGGDVLAFEAFDSLGRQWPGVFAYAMNRSKVWLNRKNYESTLKSVQDMLANVRKAETGIRQQAESQIGYGNFEQGQDLAAAANHLAVMVGRLLTRRAEVLFMAELEDEALKALNDAVNASRRVPEAWYRKGQILAERGEFSSAIAAFRRVLEQSGPNRAIHQDALVWIENVFREESRVAVTEASKELRLKDEYRQGLTVEEQEEILDAARLVAYGRGWYRQGRFQKIIDEFRQAQAQWPNILEIPLLLARSYRELGQGHLSEFWYDNVLEQNANQPEALAGKAAWLALRNEKSRATQLLLKLRQVDPDSAATRAAFGWFWYLSGDFGRAIRSLKEAIKLEPREGEWHYRLGMSWLRLGSFDMAARKFEDARVAGYPYTRVHLLKGLSLLKAGRAREGEKALLSASSEKADSPEIRSFARKLLANLSEARQLNTTDPQALPAPLRALSGFRMREKSLRELEFAVEEAASGSTLQAVELLQKRLEVDPKNLSLIHATAVLELMLEREEQAWQRLWVAQDEYPWDWRILGSIAEIAFRRGMIDQSLLAWNRMPADSGFLDEEKLLAPIFKELNQRLQIQADDEWAIYHKALLFVHTRQDSEALEILSRHAVREDRRTEYGPAIQILRAQILYRLGLTSTRSELKDEALKLLEQAGYRYVEVARRYNSVEDVLPPPPVKIPGIEPVPEEQIAYLKSKTAKEATRQPMYQTVPMLRKADNLVVWKKLDAILKDPDHIPQRVLSSYDLYLKKKRGAEEEYAPMVGREKSKEADKNQAEFEEKIQTEYENRMKLAVDRILNGRLGESLEFLQEAVSFRPDGEEAYFGIMALLLLDGRYEELGRLTSILDGLTSHRVMVLALKAHMSFQRGLFSQAQSWLEMLPDGKRLPSNRIVRALLQVYTDTARRAPKDFEANFRLGLLLGITLQYDKAALAYRRVEGPRGLVSYLCEALAFQAHQEMRLSPAQEALKLMGQLSELEKRETWIELSKDLDRFVREFRFVTQ